VFVVRVGLMSDYLGLLLLFLEECEQPHPCVILTQCVDAGLELWGKELSFGHSKRFKSGLFAVKPRKADEMMPHTVFRDSIDMGSISISRYR
jgi:hypothetical protein